MELTESFRITERTTEILGVDVVHFKWCSIFVIFCPSTVEPCGSTLFVENGCVLFNIPLVQYSPAMTRSEAAARESNV